MAKEPAFAFVLEELMSSRLADRVRVKAMFGAHAVYVGDKIHFILRDKGDATRRDDGIWVVIHADHVKAVRAEFPELRRIELFRKMGVKQIPTWWNLPETSGGFEADAGRLIELVLRGDERLGKVPKSKLPKKKKPKPKSKAKRK
jgi:hypothetical protein